MKKMIVSILSIILILSLIVSFSGCGRSTTMLDGSYDDYIVLDGSNGQSTNNDQAISSSDTPSDMEVVSTDELQDNSGSTSEQTSSTNVSSVPKYLAPIASVADTDIMKGDDIKNILLIGQDRRINDPEVRRSDAMIIFSINLKTNKINLVSLMRDMYVPYSNGEEGMINATYYKGDFELLDATIEQDFGIHIDGNMELDFFRFRDFYDLIGPIDLELNEIEVNYLNSKDTVKWTAQAGVDSSNWNLKVGMNSLDSGQLLSFARTRYVGWGDWERTDRQRRIIMATYNKLKDYDINRLSRIAVQCTQYLRTDMTKAQMMGYLYQILSHHITEFGSYRIPLEGTYTQEVREETLHVLVPQLEPNAKAAQEYIYGS